MAGLKGLFEKPDNDTELQEKVKAAVDGDGLSDEDLDNVAGGKATTIDNPEEIKSW